MIRKQLEEIIKVEYPDQYISTREERNHYYEFYLGIYLDHCVRSDDNNMIVKIIDRIVTEKVELVDLYKEHTFHIGFKSIKKSLEVSKNNGDACILLCKYWPQYVFYLQNLSDPHDMVVKIFKEMKDVYYPYDKLELLVPDWGISNWLFISLLDAYESSVELIDLIRRKGDNYCKRNINGIVCGV